MLRNIKLANFLKKILSPCWDHDLRDELEVVKLIFIKIIGGMITWREIPQMS